MPGQQPLVQVSTPIRPNELPQVVVRADDVPDLLTAEEVLQHLKENILAHMASVVSELKGTPGSTQEALNNLQNAGLNPAVVQQPPAPQPAYQAPSPPQAPPPVAAPSAQCPACSRTTACPVCGGPTEHKIKAAKANPQGYNAHICINDPGSKGHLVWCKTPIPSSLRAAVGNNPNLVYG